LFRVLLSTSFFNVRGFYVFSLFFFQFIAILKILYSALIFYLCRRLHPSISEDVWARLGSRCPLEAVFPSSAPSGIQVFLFEPVCSRFDHLNIFLPAKGVP
jgi:hypothetical protein